MNGVAIRQKGHHKDRQNRSDHAGQPESQLCIEKVVYLDAPVAEVWLALVDPDRFGVWFGTKLDKPFRVNEYSHGTSTYPGCEQLRWRAVTETLDHERLLAFTWWPAPVDVPVDDSATSGTLVEMCIRATVDGTRAIFRESGFDAVADTRERDDMIRVRAQGWNVQANNLRNYFAVQ